MAGSAKPSISQLGSEITNYTINGYLLDNSTTPAKLFDAVLGTSQWGSNPSWVYFYSNTSYIDITIPSKFNLWIYPTSDYPNYNGILKIQKYNGTSWTDIGTETTALNGTVTWQKTCSNFDSGRYKFMYNSSHRIDSEWYLEKIETKIYLIKQNGSYYTIKSTNYDSTTTHNFIPLTLTGVTTPNKSDIDTFGFNDLNLLTNSMTVGSDTFSPISKFDNTAELKMYKG